MNQPAYSLEEFEKACREGTEKAYVIRGAMETAKRDFNLNTQKAVLDFIGNKGLERPEFQNSKDWENNPDPTKPIRVDSYGFYSGNLAGYIAFFFQPLANKWNIKSFKKNSQGDPRNLPFSNLESLIKASMNSLTGGKNEQ